MSRIRSIHPGLWTDDAFMALSAHARLLVIGLWTEAYDDGVFEWKPLTLKARIFPADNIDMAALLEELLRGDFIMRDNFKEGNVGLIRNFRLFQRPKKPNSSGLLDPQWRTYVGITNDDAIPVPNQLPTGTEKPPQMEDGGGKMEDEEIESPPPVSVASGAGDIFDEVWKTFPRNPQSSEGDASRAWQSVGSADHGGVLAAAQRYAAWFAEDCIRRKRTELAGRDFVPKLSTWLGNYAWREAGSLPIKSESAAPVVPMMKLDRDRDGPVWLECERIRGKKAPTSNWEWAFPTEVVEQAKANLSSPIKAA